MNDAIKNAIQHYIEKNNTLTEDTKKTFYKELVEEGSQVVSLREDLNNALNEVKNQIIRTNIILLFEQIFKDNKEKSIEILDNTYDVKIFYDLSDSLNKLLICFSQYKNNYHFNSSELKQLKNTFALDDDKLFELINEINLDNT